MSRAVHPPRRSRERHLIRFDSNEARQDTLPGWARTARAALRVLVVGLAVVLAGLFLFPADKAHAGRSCEQAKSSPALFAKGMQLAERTSQGLDATGARVVLLARAGQDLSKYNLRYSHLGIAYKTDAGPCR